MAKKKTLKTTKTAVQKKAASAGSEDTVKKITAEPEKKKLTAKPEAKKITTAKELEKISAAKEPDKIAAKPEPKKIVTEEQAKIAADTVRKESKAAKSSDDIDKAVKEQKKPVKKAAAKSAEKDTNKTVKKAVKKTTDKTADAEKTVKKEVKAADVPEVKTAAKTEPAKKAVKKAAPKKTATKADAKKTTVKTEEKEPVKAAVKKTAKPAVKKTTSKAKNEHFTSLTLDECLALMQNMGVMHSYEDYKSILLDESDLNAIEKNIIEGNHLMDKTFDYDKDGIDLELIKVTLQKVADTMDVKADDFKAIKKDMDASVKTKISSDDEKNAKEYLKEFKTAEKLLMIGQRKDVSDSASISELIGSDVEAFMDHFFALAYDILPTWQYDDVKFYEDFAYAILSQYADLYEKQQLRVLIDCADLYIKHGDFHHGDEAYGYILRDNQIKDYIYYRFASVYEDIDINKAKGLAYESMQYVDDRYTYYSNIVEIMNK